MAGTPGVTHTVSVTVTVTWEAQAATQRVNPAAQTQNCALTIMRSVVSGDDAGERSNDENLERNHGDSAKACDIGDAVELEVCSILLQR